MAYPSDNTSIRGLKQVGNIDLSRRPRIRNKDGSISTVRSMNFGDEKGREVLVPTAIPAYRDSRGVVTPAHIASNKEAVRRYYRTGRNLGIFDTPKNATAYGNMVHRSQAASLSSRPGPITKALQRKGK